MTEFVEINGMVHAVACRKCKSGDAKKGRVYNYDYGGWVHMMFCFQCNRMLCEPCFRNKRHMSCSKEEFVDVQEIMKYENITLPNDEWRVKW